jgi:DNA topoisomerase VI subunit B
VRASDGNDDRRHPEEGLTVLDKVLREAAPLNLLAHRLKRETFRTSRLLDFCGKKELIAQTGHPLSAWPLVVLKELLDNALDAAEDARISPSVQVTVNDQGITVSDNGPGIPTETIEGVLDFAVRVSNREAYVSPTRGAQGNALKTIVAMPFALHGEEGKIEIVARDKMHAITMRVDRIRQQPVLDLDRTDAGNTTGTRITVCWPDSASLSCAVENKTS